MKHDPELHNISSETLAKLGNNQVAYLKHMSTNEVKRAFPEAEDVPENTHMWVLFSADGTPLLLAENAGDAWSGAFHNDLKPVSLH